MDDVVTDVNMEPQSYTSSMVTMHDSITYVTQCDDGTLVEKAQGLTLNSLEGNTNYCCFCREGCRYRRC